MLDLHFKEPCQPTVMLCFDFFQFENLLFFLLNSFNELIDISLLFIEVYLVVILVLTDVLLLHQGVLLEHSGVEFLKQLIVDFLERHNMFVVVRQLDLLSYNCKV